MKVIPAVLVILVAAVAIAALDRPRSLMSRVEYGEAKTAMESQAQMAYVLCREQEGRTGDLCKAEARVNQRVSKADLEARYLGTVSAAGGAMLERAKAQYDFAREKCSDRRREEKVSCLRSARTEKARALAEARLAST